MKIQITLATALFQIRSTVELKRPAQKKKSPTRPKSKPSISNHINIITNK